MDAMNQKIPRRPASGGGVTAVDIVIIILLLAVTFGTIFGWVYEALDDDLNSEIGYTFVVSFRIAETHREVLDGLTKGDQLYFAEEGDFLGYLRDDLKVADSASAPTALDRVTGTGSMVCVGNDQNRSLRVGDSDRYLTPGDTLWIRTEREVLSVYILDIQKLS